MIALTGTRREVDRMARLIERAGGQPRVARYVYRDESLGWAVTSDLGARWIEAIELWQDRDLPIRQMTRERLIALMDEVGI